MDGKDPTLIAAGIALAGQAAILAGWKLPGGIVLLVGWAWWGAMIVRSQQDTAPTQDGKPGRQELVALAGITLVAAACRFPALGSVPPGLVLDEGRLGLLAQALLRGEDPRPWLHSMELFSMLATSAVFAVAGPTVAALRSIPAACGTATVPALWWVARPLLGPGPALAGGFVLAVSRWHIEQSRMAFGVIQMPLLALLAAGCFIRAWKGRGNRWWILSGLATGFTVHTYFGARPYPAVMAAAIAAWMLGPDSADRRRGAVLRWSVSLAAGFAVGGWYLPWHPGRLLYRFGEVSGGLSGPLSVAGNIFRGLGGFNIRGGDLVQNFPAPGGSPMLGLFAAAFWLPGLLMVFRRLPKPALVLFIAWTTLGLAGAAFEGPHGMRMFILSPVVALAAGTAAAGLCGKGRPGLLFAAILALGCTGTELWRYAAPKWGDTGSGSIEWVFRGQEVRLADRICRESGRRRIFLSPDSASPAGTPIEWFAAPTLFLSSRCVRRELPTGGRWRKGDGVMFLTVTRNHLDVLGETFPGGETWSESRENPQPTAYVVPPSSLRKAKIPLVESAGLFRTLWNVEGLLRNNRAADAVTACRELAGRWPRLGCVHAALSAALIGTRDYGKAESAARKAIDEGALGGFPWMCLGKSLASQGRPGDAAAAFERVTRDAPDDEEGWLSLIAALGGSGDAAGARAALSQAILRFPGSNRFGPVSP